MEILSVLSVFVFVCLLSLSESREGVWNSGTSGWGDGGIGTGLGV